MMAPRARASRGFTLGVGFSLFAVTGGLALVLVRCGKAMSVAEPVAQQAKAGRARSFLTNRRSSSVGAALVTMTIKCNAATHPINPLIYGIGVLPMHDAADSHQWLLGATARRWGGNHTSRYNWEHGNAWNTGKDWFFKNVDYDQKPRAAYQRFIDDDVAHGVRTALTVPIIGWAAKDTKSYGFPVSVYGPQLAVAPEDADVGNGVALAGPLHPGPPERTSVRLPPASIGRWVRAIRKQDETRGQRGVHMYILDNEPTLWHETHRDVHPNPVSYDELLERTITYAAEIRRADPDAVIAGPALWGWPAYFYSGVDHAAQPAHPDQDRHGGVPLLAWWLREIAAHERRAKVRLIDVVDVHFYPQGRGLGVGVEGESDADTAARRIRATRSLWDDRYEDESWIGEKMRLLPRIREWIAENNPGLGISIGEWNFGAERHMSGGLAVAEALGRFGEQGISAAFYWDYPDRDSPAFWAFRAFRNFDGKGGRFLDESVPAESSDQSASIFVSRDGTGQHLVVVLLALDPAKPVAVELDTSTCGRILNERRFVYTGGDAGLVPTAKDASVPGSGEPLPSSERLPLPPYSMTVLDLHLAPDR